MEQSEPEAAMAREEKRQNAQPSSDDVTVPTATGDQATSAKERVAIYTGEASMQPPEDWERIPDEVANELGLDPGQKLVVHQKPVRHIRDGDLVKTVQDEDGYVDLIDLAQAIVDETVTSSNFGLPRIKLRPFEDDDEFLDAPETRYWLADWLGARDLLERMVRVGGDAHDFRRGPGGS